MNIKCASCKKDNKISDLILYQTHWYVYPFSCYGGDYWNVGEGQVICSFCKVVNRLLFEDEDGQSVSKTETKFYKEAKFKDKTNTYNNDDPSKLYKWANNFMKSK